MKKTILIIVAVIVLLVILMAFFGFLIEKGEVKEATPRFEELYEAAMVAYETDTVTGIRTLEEALYYGHTHSLVGYEDVMVTGYNKHYQDGLNLLARHYRARGKSLEHDGKLQEALNQYERIFTYTDRDASVAYKKGPEVDLLYTDIKRIRESMQ